MREHGWSKGRRRIRGQSTLEYILVIAAILAAVIVAATALINPAVTKTMSDSKGIIENTSGKLTTGLGLNQANNGGGGSAGGAQ